MIPLIGFERENRIYQKVSYTPTFSFNLKKCKIEDTLDKKLFVHRNDKLENKDYIDKG
jgi:hypothetical protein